MSSPAEALAAHLRDINPDRDPQTIADVLYDAAGLVSDPEMADFLNETADAVNPQETTS
jgi:hypothetical protein